MSRSCRACASARKSPEELMNFRAFHSAGLWLAVIAMPPTARRSRTSSWTVGTGQMSRSTTRQPLESSPATTACRTIAPEERVSRPTTMAPGPVYVPNACAKRTSSAGVRDSPTTPRTPEMLIFSVGIARIKIWSRTRRAKRFAPTSRRRLLARDGPVVREEPETLRAFEVEAEESAPGGLLFAERAGHVELIHARAAEGDVARREIPGRVAPQELALRTDDLHLPHPVVRDVEVAVRVEADAVRLVADL